MIKKVGIATVCTGYNYGSSLQAYAMKKYVHSLGYESDLLGCSGTLVPGRDVRLKKLFTIFCRTIWRPSLLRKNVTIYTKVLHNELSERSKALFHDFYVHQLKVSVCKWKQLKRSAARTSTFAYICGSDQIWNATSMYVDPFYYLKFAPKSKRIAYAPSFGKSQIPNYNKTKLAKHISQIDYLSVREGEGVQIIQDLIHKEVPALLDPTLLIAAEDWKKFFRIKNVVGEPYVLLYFLDKPSRVAIETIQAILTVLACKAIVIPYHFDAFFAFKNVHVLDAGPIEFISLVHDAAFVCTDSFHGTAFSVNFNIPFFTFKRNYGEAENQSSRIVSLLQKIGLLNRFIDGNNDNTTELSVDFYDANLKLMEERKSSREYLINAFDAIERGSNAK